MSGTIVNLGTTDWDAADGRDRALLRGLIHNKRWDGLNDPKKSEVLDALFVALQYAKEDRDARAVASIVRTIVAMEGQNQADQHKGLDLLFRPKAETQTVHIDLFVIPSPVRKRLDDTGAVRRGGGDGTHAEGGGADDGPHGPPA